MGRILVGFNHKNITFFLKSIDCTSKTLETTNAPYAPESASTPSPRVQLELQPQPMDSTSPKIIVYHKKSQMPKEIETLADL
ncbi:unnamed protein product [Dovyalis caffra]|uniref:Uncharacterized protein n=1 Tax=Dovyalis caffra TaxID=77055 RepID=A0AAV1RTT2_9ROSI|nr:unnamed protein product [Dovyalis caffra]